MWEVCFINNLLLLCHCHFLCSCFGLALGEKPFEKSTFSKYRSVLSPSISYIGSELQSVLPHQSVASRVSFDLFYPHQLFASGVSFDLFYLAPSICCIVRKLPGKSMINVDVFARLIAIYLLADLSVVYLDILQKSLTHVKK